MTVFNILGSEYFDNAVCQIFIRLFLVSIQTQSIYGDLRARLCEVPFTGGISTIVVYHGFRESNFKVMIFKVFKPPSKT